MYSSDDSSPGCLIGFVVLIVVVGVIVAFNDPTFLPNVESTGLRCLLGPLAVLGMVLFYYLAPVLVMEIIKFIGRLLWGLLAILQLVLVPASVLAVIGIVIALIVGWLSIPLALVWTIVGSVAGGLMVGSIMVGIARRREAQSRYITMEDNWWFYTLAGLAAGGITTAGLFFLTAYVNPWLIGIIVSGVVTLIVRRVLLLKDMQGQSAGIG